MTEPVDSPMAPADYPLVRAPLSLRNLHLRNRIVRCAHGTGLAKDVVSDELIEFHRARAAGGVGLMILGDGYVHSSASGVLALWRPEVVPGLARLRNAIHGEGVGVIQQLSHQGPAALNLSPPWSASAVPVVVSGRVPIRMSPEMIADVVEGYAKSALHCREAGFDGVEIHAGHGFLVGQFLSPATNQRDDEYGRTVEGRERMLFEVLRAVREAVGGDFVVGVRLSVDENIPDGIVDHDTADLALRLERLKMVDFFDLSTGHLNSYQTIIGGMHEPRGYQLAASAKVARVVSLPTLALGRIHTIAEAEAVLESGEFDLVGITRPTIADPELVRKSLEGRAAEVRPCIACNHCVASMTAADRRLSCAVNVRAGRETTLAPLEQVGSRRRVLIVGGGPAGLEAALVAAERGHDVILCEELDDLGGSITVAASAPHRTDLAAIVTWQAEQVRAAGVDVRCGCRVDGDLIASVAPDAVIVATGGRPRRDGMQAARPAFRPDGIDQSHVCAPVDVLGTNDMRPGSAVVVDDLGTYEAVAVAETLAHRGTRVIVATRFHGIAADLGPNLEQAPALQRLGSLGVEVIPRALLTEVRSDTAVLESIVTGEVRVVDAALVVMVSPVVPRADLERDLADWGGEVLVVGDAVSPRDLIAAVREGDTAGRAL